MSFVHITIPVVRLSQTSASPPTAVMLAPCRHPRPPLSSPPTAVIPAHRCHPRVGGDPGAHESLETLDSRSHENDG